MQARHFLSLFSGGFFILLDQLLKWQATHGWHQAHLINRFLGWDPFLNPGIAFGLPLPTPLILGITFPILIMLTLLIARRWKTFTERPLELLAFIFLFSGALSNGIDRLIYRHTIDYLRIFFSIFNVADVLIVLGFMLYFLQTQKTNKKEQSLFTQY